MRCLGCLFVLTACGGGGGFPDASEIDAPPKGNFSATWSVIDQNGTPVACDRIGGNTMTVLAHNKAFDGGLTELFGCAEGMGTSQAVVAGVYDFNFELGGIVGLLATAPQQGSVSIPAGQTTPIAPLVFQVQATGGVALTLNSGKSGGNCGTAVNGGAGITGVTITMTHNSDATCEPLQLDISAGASQPASTYTIDCTTPAVAGCIESDQTITATGISSDSYTIHISAKIGAMSCWINNDTLQIPPLDKTLMRTLNLAEQTQTPGC